MANPPQRRNDALPGCLYQRNGRWWWRVRLPGQTKPSARPLVPEGRRYATTDRKVAVAIADRLYRQASHPGRHQGLTVAELAALYRDYARRHYHRGEACGVAAAMDLLVAVAGKGQADMVTIPTLLEARRRLIARDRARTTCNRYIAIILRAYRWAGEQYLIPPSLAVELSLIRPLRRGRTEARETDPVVAVPEATVYATMAQAPDAVRDLIELQMLTGARSGELVSLRPSDIDASGPIWVAQLDHHKTAHLGRQRAILFGPRCQEILGPRILGAPLQKFAFANSLGRPYTTETYRRAVAKAAELAGVPSWHPHQLRHLAAARVRRELGLDAARAYLGHAGAAITDMYAGRDHDLALDVARKLG